MELDLPPVHTTISKVKTIHSNFLSPPRRVLLYFTIWSAASRPHRGDPILSAISEAIFNFQTKPLEFSLKRVLPSLTPNHVSDLINFNPHSLHPPNILYYSVLLTRHYLCSHRMIPEARTPSICCQNGIQVTEGDAEWWTCGVPGVVTYDVLMNGLRKRGQMRNAKMLWNSMPSSGVVPDDITFNILLEGHCKQGNADEVHKLRSHRGLITDYSSYISFIDELSNYKQIK